MKFEAIPLIKLQLDGIKVGVIQALGVEGSEFGKQVEAAMDKAIAEYDLEGEIAKATGEAIAGYVQQYFAWNGEGRKAIERAVTATMSELFRFDSDCPLPDAPDAESEVDHE